MPGRDRMGPTDAGLMTGRRAGYCVGHNGPGFFRQAKGFRTRFKGSFINRGGGHGWRYRCFDTDLPGWPRGGFATLTNEQELVELKNLTEWHKSQLEIIEKRIGEFELE